MATTSFVSTFPSHAPRRFSNICVEKMMDTLCRRDYDEFVTLLKPEMERAKKSGISGKQIISVRLSAT